MLMDKPDMSRVRHAHHTKTTPLNERQLYTTTKTFKTLSDPTRLKILRALADGNTCVHKLYNQLNINQPTISHQLHLLHIQHLIHTQHTNHKIYYSLKNNHILSLLTTTYSHTN